MPSLDPITILVLGPMGVPPDATAAAKTRTEDLTALLEAIRVRLLSELGFDRPIIIEGPDDNPVADIIPGILRKIERADLIVCDVSTGSQNVMYELGLIHALGLPYIVVTRSDERPFYVANLFCVTNFVLSRDYDPNNRSHSLLLARIRTFLNTQRTPGNVVAPEDFAANPVTAYFGLPIVDISAPAGLAAGYWRNFVQRFVRPDGYFDSPIRTVSLAGPAPEAPRTERTIKIGHLVVVPPVDGLKGSEPGNWLRLEETLGGAGLTTIDGDIVKVSIRDQRFSGVKFLARIMSDGTTSVVDPGVVIDMPTTLYALQYSARITKINVDSVIAADRDSVQRLRARRYQDMIERFGRILQGHIIQSDYREHVNQLHYVMLPELPPLLQGILQAA